MSGDSPADPQKPVTPDPCAKAPSPEEAAIREQFPEAVLEAILAVDVPTFTLDWGQIEAVARFLKEALNYRMPLCASGVDRGEHLEVVYHLMSLSTHRIVALKVAVPREDPHAPSLTGVWCGVDWHEREIFDLLGIRFDGHPDLRRILLPDDWEGHPLRKDYTEID
jgi:NADH-quinone oxidoreductase subunit C